MSTKQSKPAPTETGRGQQQDDNIDDLGRRPDGKKQDQPIGGHENRADVDKSGEKHQNP